MERTKRPAKAGAQQQSEPTVAKTDGKITWVNTGGNFIMKDGTTIARKEKFQARPEDIPKAFRDTIKPLDPIPSEKVLPAPTGGYKIKDRSDGMFDIVDSKGKTVNEKPMPEDDAKSILAKLN